MLFEIAFHQLAPLRVSAIGGMILLLACGGGGHNVDTPAAAARSLPVLPGPLSPGPAPELVSVTPERGKAGDQVTIAVRNLMVANEYLFGTTKAEMRSFNTVNGTGTAKVLVPSGVYGPVRLTVTDAKGSVSNGLDFLVEGSQAEHLPVLHSVNPDTEKPGVVVKLSGRNLGDAQVFFGNVDATAVIHRSRTRLDVVVPHGVSGAVAITARNAAGATHQGLAFNVKH